MKNARKTIKKSIFFGVLGENFTRKSQFLAFRVIFPVKQLFFLENNCLTEKKSRERLKLHWISEWNSDFFVKITVSVRCVTSGSAYCFLVPFLVKNRDFWPKWGSKKLSCNCSDFFRARIVVRDWKKSTLQRSLGFTPKTRKMAFFGGFRAKNPIFGGFPMGAIFGGPFLDLKNGSHWSKFDVFQILMILRIKIGEKNIFSQLFEQLLSFLRVYFLIFLFFLWKIWKFRNLARKNAIISRKIAKKSFFFDDFGRKIEKNRNLSGFCESSGKN